MDGMTSTGLDSIVAPLNFLAPMAEKGLVRVAVSVTTLDASLARKMEPRASTPSKRFEAIRALAEAVEFSFDRVGYANGDRFVELLPSFQNLHVTSPSCFFRTRCQGPETPSAVHASCTKS